jgi:type VI protein secretion system component Hcp
MRRFLFRAAPAVIAGLLTFVALFFAPSTLVAQDPIYMSLANVQGGSEVPGHVGWINVESATLGSTVLSEANLGAVRQQFTGGAGKPKVHELTIVKEMDSASPKLFQAAATNPLVGTVTIDILDLGGPGKAQPNLLARLILSKCTMRIRRQAPNKEVIVLTAETVSLR